MGQRWGRRPEPLEKMGKFAPFRPAQHGIRASCRGLPAYSDFHQDHQVIAREGVRAFQQTSILGYERSKNTLPPLHACFVKLEERHIVRKIESMKCYRSQVFRTGMNEEVLRGLATIRGAEINEGAAEAFEVLRLVT